jgi:SAM-dependent methyltransferase
VREVTKPIVIPPSEVPEHPEASFDRIPPGVKRAHRQLTHALAKVYKVLVRFRAFEMGADYLLWRFFPNASIPFLESSRTTGDMEHDWDIRAQFNLLMSATGYTSQQEADASAVDALQRRILKGVNITTKSVVLEIGCGMGNLLRPLSHLVREAYGVDISGEMIRRAKSHLRDCRNVSLHKTTGGLGMLPDSHFDFVFSSGVFIHFPQKGLVYGYFREVARVLKRGGTFRFHVDGRGYLRWRRRNGGSLRGVVFTAGEIRDNLDAHGFRALDIVGENTAEMWTTAQLRDVRSQHATPGSAVSG